MTFILGGGDGKDGKDESYNLGEGFLFYFARP